MASDTREHVSPDILASLIALVREYGYGDLDAYRSNTFERQLAIRMSELGMKDAADYLAFAQREQAEVHRLRNSVLISVTTFFRDAPVFQRLQLVLASLLQQSQGVEPLRIWIPGCATGQEPYSVAMMLQELTGSGGARVPIRIFATDLDEAAIAKARRGTYTQEEVANVSSERLARHFVQEGDSFRINRAVRDTCIFAVHDLLTQPALMHLDLIVCRNVLIYLQANVQDALLRRFSRALRPNGWLQLGQSESLNMDECGFVPHDRSVRLFRKSSMFRPMAPGADSLLAKTQKTAGESSDFGQPDTIETRFHKWVTERDVRPTIVVNDAGAVLHWVGQVEPFLNFGTGSNLSVGGLLQPELRDEATSLMKLALLTQGRAVQSPTLPVPPSLFAPEHAGGVVMSAQALPAHVGGKGCYALSFAWQSRTDVQDDPSVHALREELAMAREQIHALAGSLDDSDAARVSLREEAQVAEEELQASNEELQASNEELQSLNEQLLAKSDELVQLNDLMLNVERSMHVSLIVIDADLHIQRFNPLAVRVLGLLPSDVGRSLVSIPACSDWVELPAQIARTFKTGEAHSHEVVRGQRYYLMQVAPLRDMKEQVSGAVLSLSDITERRQSEIERARLAAVVNDSEDAIVSKTLDGLITTWNPGAERLFGYSAEEMIGRPMLIVFPADLQSEEHLLLSTIARGESVPAFDTVRRHKDGRELQVSVALSPIRNGAGEIVGISKIARDISARFAAEAQRTANLLRLEEEVSLRTAKISRQQTLLQSVLDGMPGMVALWRTSGELNLANQAQQELLVALNESDHPLQALARSLHPQWSDRKEAVSRVISGQSVEYDVGPVAGKGTQRHFWRVLLEPYWLEGAVVGYISLAWDVTSLREAETAAEQANRAKSEFLASISHEIRTPLNGVLGLAQLGQRQAGDATAVGLFAQILESGKHLLGLINDVLDFSKIEAGKVTVTSAALNLQDMIQRVVDLIHYPARTKGLELKVHTGPDVAQVYLGDALHISQALVNLMGNAVKFTSTGSVSLHVAVQGRGLLFSVVDTGPGIEAKSLTRLFQPFEQGRRDEKGGTGLGLSISKRLIELMGGWIRADSVPDQGSVFRFWLPMEPVVKDCAPAVPVHTSLLAVRDAEARLYGIRVLVAEDHPLNVFVLTGLLKTEGAEVEVAQHGQEAVDSVQRSLVHLVAPFDIVLTDIEMPVLDGYEVARRIGAMEPRLPVVGLSAHAFSEARQACLDAGMAGFITKPFLVDELVQEIRRLTAASAVPDPVSPPPNREQATRHAPDQGGVLRQLVGDSPEDRERVLTLFTDGLTTLMDQMHKAVQTSDWLAVRRCAHRLRSSSAMLGEAQLAKHLHAIEASCRQGDTDSIRALLQQLGVVAQAAVQNLASQLGRVVG